MRPLLASLLVALLAASVFASPVYWLDLEKQLLYSFDDPELIRFSSHVEDRHQQPIFDIAAIEKRYNEGRLPLTRTTSLRHLSRVLQQRRRR